ncbi:MAG: hypothetical protein K2N38_12995 [Oscillospiraceae bacterium]|nr:hypothetical protein [Oscillospiraceae bacterium]
MTYDDLIGKTMLAGITYMRGDEVEESVQLFGTVISADDEEIAVELADGKVWTLPPDLSAVQPAQKGIYRLKSTGEEIEDPDFTSVWTCYLNDQK